MSPPKKKDPELPVPAIPTTASDWKRGASEAAPLQVPSGNVALVRNPGMKAFLKAGIVPNVLLVDVQKSLAKGQTPSFAKMAKGDDSKLTAMLEMVDNVICSVVAEPRVHAVPKDEHGNELERDEDLLYVDDVDPDDKFFIFQWVCGGTRDLERFRSEYEAALSDLPGGEDVVRATQSARRPAPAAKRKSGGGSKRKR